MELYIIGCTVLLGLYLAWTIGANDFANSMSDAVGSGALSIRGAVIMGALCEFAGSTLVGSSVTDTVRRGIVSPHHFVDTPEMLALGMISALLATAVWLHVATWIGMPVSTTHSIVGAIAGFGMVAAGLSCVEWSKFGGIVLSWLVSPVAGAALGFILFKSISILILRRERPLRAAILFAPFFVFLTVFIVAMSTLFKGLDHVLHKHNIILTGGQALLISVGAAMVCTVIARVIIQRYVVGRDRLPLADQLRLVEGIFTPLVIITSCSVAFAHGANDVANAIGPVAAVLDIVRSGTVKMRVFVPFWVLAMGGFGIVLGLATSGHRVMKTLGTKITQLTPSRGTAADLATVATVLVCTRLKMPVSTTHTIVGAIIGVGFARGLGAVNKRVTRDIFGSWLITVPAAGLLTVVLFLIARAAGLGGLILEAMPKP